MEKLNSDPIGELVRKSEQDYVNGTVNISKYVEKSMYDDICKIDAYLNSKHTTGEKDSLNRDKPFFNIVVAAVNIWFRATDIDRKNIRIKATNSKEMLPAFLATVHLHDFMNQSSFGKFLNTWGLTLARYGSAVSKFVEKKDGLHAMVVPWQRLIVDPIDFDNNPKIEILEMTPAQLRKHKEYDQAMVEKLINSVQARSNLGNQKKDNRDNYIKIYELHGELPLSWITGNERDDEEYVQQMQILSFVASKERGKFDDFILYAGEEKEDPYIITHLIEEDGQTLSMGAVQNLFENQWMVNHTAKAIKDQLDLASRLIFQTADPGFVGQNALSAIESGDILVWNKDIQNGQLTQLANNSHDITALQSFGQQWQQLAQDITATPDVMRGNNMPSGTAFRQALVIQQESHSLFEIMTENKGLALEEMMRRYIIPYIKKQLNTSDEIVATLDMAGIDKIEQIYVSNEAIRRTNRKAVQAVLNRRNPEVNLPAEQTQIKNELSMLGNQRFIKPSEIDSKTWKDILSNLEEWQPEVEITNENTDKEATLTTLSNVLQTIAGNPSILQDPNAKMLFNRILEETGRVSPIELSETTSQPTPIPQQIGQTPQPVIK